MLSPGHEDYGVHQDWKAVPTCDLLGPLGGSWHGIMTRGSHSLNIYRKTSENHGKPYNWWLTRVSNQLICSSELQAVRSGEAMMWFARHCFQIILTSWSKHPSPAQKPETGELYICTSVNIKVVSIQIQICLFVRMYGVRLYRPTISNNFSRDWRLCLLEKTAICLKPPNVPLILHIHYELPLINQYWPTDQTTNDHDSPSLMNREPLIHHSWTAKPG